MQKLLTDKSLRHGDNLCTLICKHLYGPLPKKIQITIYQDIFTYIPQVYRRCFLCGQVIKQLENWITYKHPSVKFEYEISKERILVLDTEIYIKIKLHAKIFRKKIDRQTFLNMKSEHPKSLKNSIQYSETLRIKRICSTKKDFDHHSRELKERFSNEGYDKKPVDEQLENVDKLVRDDLLQKKIENNKIENAFH